ncbi:hypothetical protein Acr_18g0009670 [Actinidia rufa]|uniref:Uncharacterized protein n=1 Tax=Actinidia rufa TaxID=165716 RepID=A0A7J0G7M7_9ERIC|nr:hypothetical protein Acr_18g0009670 [Actinidia rufa]
MLAMHITLYRTSFARAPSHDHVEPFHILTQILSSKTRFADQIRFGSGLPQSRPCQITMLSRQSVLPVAPWKTLLHVPLPVVGRPCPNPYRVLSPTLVRVPRQLIVGSDSFHLHQSIRVDVPRLGFSRENECPSQQPIARVLG